MAPPELGTEELRQLRRLLRLVHERKPGVASSGTSTAAARCGGSVALAVCCCAAACWAVAETAGAAAGTSGDGRALPMLAPGEHSAFLAPMVHGDSLRGQQARSLPADRSVQQPPAVAGEGRQEGYSGFALRGLTLFVASSLALHLAPRLAQRRLPFGRRHPALQSVRGRLAAASRCVLHAVETEAQPEASKAEAVNTEAANASKEASKTEAVDAKVEKVPEEASKTEAVDTTVEKVPEEASKTETTSTEAVMVSAEAPKTEAADSEAEKIFKEAYTAELERVKLLRSQLEAVLSENLRKQSQDMGSDSTMKISVEVPDLSGPGNPGGKATWREAYQAAKAQAEGLEEQLKKAKQLGKPPPPPAAASSTLEPGAVAAAETAAEAAAPKAKQSDDDSFSVGPFGILDASKQDPASFQKLEDLAQNVIEDEATLRLIAVPILGRRRAEGASGMLPSLGRVRAAFGSDVFNISEPVEFERLYVLKGTVAAGVEPGDALAKIRQSFANDGLDRNVDIFLQKSKEEGRSICLVMLKEDLPKNEFAWWQWGLCLLLFIFTLLSVNVTSFAVSTFTATEMRAMDLQTMANIANKTIPTAVAVFGTVAVQEIARRVAASNYKIELTPPFFIPVWPFPSVGTLGAVSRRLTLAPNEESVLAMSVAASAAGYLFSFAVLLVGLSMGPDPDKIVNLNFQLLPLILKFVLKPLLGQNSVADQPDPFADPIILAFPSNPVVIGGVIGIIVTSLNLLPIGRLDGGAIAKAIMGNGAGVFSWLALSVLALGALGPSNNDAGLLYITFGFFSAFLQNGSEIPPTDAVTKPPDALKILGVILVVLGTTLSVPGALFPNV